VCPGFSAGGSVHKDPPCRLGPSIDRYDDESQAWARRRAPARRARDRVGRCARGRQRGVRLRRCRRTLDLAYSPPRAFGKGRRRPIPAANQRADGGGRWYDRNPRPASDPTPGFSPDVRVSENATACVTPVATCYSSKPVPSRQTSRSGIGSLLPLCRTSRPDSFDESASSLPPLVSPYPQVNAEDVERHGNCEGGGVAGMSRREVDGNQHQEKQAAAGAAPSPPIPAISPIPVPTRHWGSS
jgi:hypothetical protein